MFKYGCNGIRLALINSKLLLLYTFSAISLIACYIFHASEMEWFSVLICSGVLMALEMINTSIEKICDMIDSNPNLQIKVIKDISSGAVLMFTIFTFFVGCMIFIPKLLMYI